ncbi:MAG: dihydrofolate reductase [Ruminococcaceae bacterium]|nr:dihydrofolate reductase [Oscillospiraceae bacterium]
MNLIVATDKNWGIGKDGTMPWHISADLKYFKEKTVGKRVIMGRKTLLSFPKQKPLPNRENVVISTNPSYVVEGAQVVNSTYELSRYDMGNDTFIIGGGSIYKALLPYCKYAYITKIEDEFECDTYFPNLDELENWKMIDEGELLNENGIDFRFTVYENSDVAAFAAEDADDYNDNMPPIDEIDFNEFELLCTVDDEFDADVKISLLRSCSIMAIKRYSSYSAVAKIYCGNSNLGVMIYVQKDKLDEAREILNAPFDESELGE